MKPTRLEIFSAVLSAAVAIISAVIIVGQPARLVVIVTLVAGSLGAGIVLGRIIERWKGQKRN